MLLCQNPALQGCVSLPAHVVDPLEASQKLGPCCGGCSLLHTFPGRAHGSALADRGEGPGEIRKKLNGLGSSHCVLCTLPSVYISLNVTGRV